MICRKKNKRWFLRVISNLAVGDEVEVVFEKLKNSKKSACVGRKGLITLFSFVAHFMHILFIIFISYKY